MDRQRDSNTPDAAAEADQLTRLLATALPRGAIGAVRAICDGDELLLAPTEMYGLERAVVSVRRASGAGRDVARLLCHRMGVNTLAIPRQTNRVPLWPAGLVGSIAHDRKFAAAAVAPANLIESLGIDIEPAEPLPPDMPELIALADELSACDGCRFGHKALFSIKEAIFKAVFPRDGVFLEFHDVTVDWAARTAVTCYGRRVNWRVYVEPRVVATAWI